MGDCILWTLAGVGLLAMIGLISSIFNRKEEPEELEEEE